MVDADGNTYKNRVDHSTVLLFPLLFERTQ